MCIRYTIRTRFSYTHSPALNQMRRNGHRSNRKGVEPFPSCAKESNIGLLLCYLV
ncbi:gp62 [Listeria phage A511]|uniref:Gp62 n=1 Tax=Listeria phage A511 TaxID=2908169 RepID=A8AT86_BPA51|nr:gp62 [Listeria phage A511]AAY53033.1 gp62 [Listeria phage A511]